MFYRWRSIMRLVREMRLYMTRKLFRYRSFNTEIINVYSNVHQKLIGIEKWKLEAFEGVVYPSSPLYFNDPYDCDFCMQRDALEGILDRETLIQALGKKFKLKKNEKNRILKTKNIENTIQKILQDHGASLNGSWMHVLQNGLNDCMSKIKNSVRVVCLSEVYDSILMWSHYAQNHTGFCIEYDFEENNMFYKRLYPVKYTKDRYAISKADMSNSNTHWIYKTICSKSDVWSYEKEWRIVTANFEEMVLKNLEGKYVFDLKTNIKSFYLGAKIAENFKKEVIEFGQKNNIHVYQMVLSPNTYDLEAEKII